MEVEVLLLSESASHISPQISLLIAERPETIREYLPGLYEHEYNYLFRGSSQPSDGGENL